MPSKKERLRQRKRPARGVIEIAGQPTIVFDTVCTKDRVRWLACDAVHQLLIQVWTEATAWLMGRYMIMPDHIHFFAGYRDGAIEYENWVKYWKSQFTKRLQRPEWRWQADDFDHRVRNAASYEEKWQYTRQNPVRAGLSRAVRRLALPGRNSRIAMGMKSLRTGPVFGGRGALREGEAPAEPPIGQTSEENRPDGRQSDLGESFPNGTVLAIGRTSAAPQGQSPSPGSPRAVI